MSRNNFLIFIAIVLLFAGGVWWFSRSEDNHPCAAFNIPGKCYSVERGVCEKVWQQNVSECKEKIQNLNLSASRLTGPIAEKCQLAKYDKMFHYQLRTNAECTNLYNEIEEWRKTNSEL